MRAFFCGKSLKRIGERGRNRTFNLLIKSRLGLDTKFQRIHFRINHLPQTTPARKHFQSGIETARLSSYRRKTYGTFMAQVLSPSSRLLITSSPQQNNPDQKRHDPRYCGYAGDEGWPDVPRRGGGRGVWIECPYCEQQNRAGAHHHVRMHRSTPQPMGSFQRSGERSRRQIRNTRPTARLKNAA